MALGECLIIDADHPFRDNDLFQVIVFKGISSDPPDTVRDGDIAQIHASGKGAVPDLSHPLRNNSTCQAAAFKSAFSDIRQAGRKCLHMQARASFERVFADAHQRARKRYSPQIIAVLKSALTDIRHAFRYDDCHQLCAVAKCTVSDLAHPVGNQHIFLCIDASGQYAVFYFKSHDLPLP